jgi:hypothetical protein
MKFERERNAHNNKIFTLHGRTRKEREMLESMFCCAILFLSPYLSGVEADQKKVKIKIDQHITHDFTHRARLSSLTLFRDTSYIFKIIIISRAQEEEHTHSLTLVSHYAH